MVDVSRTEYDVIRWLYDGCNKLSGNKKDVQCGGKLLSSIWLE